MANQIVKRFFQASTVVRHGAMTVLLALMVSSTVAHAQSTTPVASATPPQVTGVQGETPHETVEANIKQLE